MCLCEYAQETSEQRRARLRRLVLVEFASSEASYVRSLEALRDAYLQPLATEAAAGRLGPVGPPDVALIAAHVDQILALNNEFFHELLERLCPPAPAPAEAAAASAAMQRHLDAVNISDVLVTFAPFFKLYIQASCLFYLRCVPRVCALNLTLALPLSVPRST